MRRLRWLWFLPVAFFVLRIVGGQLIEEAIDQRDAPQEFASSLLANAETFSIGIYLVGLSGLAFLWFAWALRKRLQQEGSHGATSVGFAGGLGWGAIYVAAAVLAATAPMLADFLQDPQSARLVVNLDISTSPLALTLLGVFALGNGLALRKTAIIAPWLAWAGVLLGVVLVAAAALQPIAEPTVSRSEEEVQNIVSFITGFSAMGLIPLWTIATGIALFRREGRMSNGI